MLHYFIDGYNLLYALPTMPSGSLEQKRDALIRLLREQRPFGRNQCTVVFDSREGGGNRQNEGDLEIVFTAGNTADDWIAAMARKGNVARTMVVVTDDKGLRGLLKGTGARAIDATGFLAKNAAKQDKPRSATDWGAITDELRDQWKD